MCHIVGLLVVTLVAITSCSPTFKDSVDHCLSPDQIAIDIYGGPSGSTPKLLDALQKHDVKVVFFVDAAKLSLGSMHTFLKSIMSRGHIIGMSIGDDVGLNNMTVDGLRGAISSRNAEFFKATGKHPLFLKVPSNTSTECMSHLADAGYYITLFGSDHSIPDTTDCTKPALQQKSLSGQSGIVGLKDADRSCPVEALEQVILSASSSSLSIVRMDECIGMQNTYQTDRVETPVNLLLNISPQSPPKRDVFDDSKDGGSVIENGRQVRARASNAVKSSASMWHLFIIEVLILLLL